MADDAEAMNTRLPLGLALLSTLSCATSPPVESDRLALRRVVIYRNGVAYFEREGHVSEDRVTFRVRADEVGDFLASFAVMEKDGSSVRAASFPLHKEEQQAADWLSFLAEEAVKEYSAAADADPAAVKALKAAFALRGDWKKATDETEKLRGEQGELERSTEETRDNLKAIEKNKAAEDLRKTLTTRLSKSAARLDTVMKRLIELDLQSKELALRFREAVKDIKIAPRS